jgi:glycosyltransferase involved in cell wall biosynthesis
VAATGFCNEGIIHRVLVRPLAEKGIDFIIPAHNEMATIGNLICTIRRWPLAGRIVVVDDDSSDETFVRAQEASPDTLVTVYQDMGKTGAVLAGLKHVSGEFVFIMDGDWRGFSPSFFDAVLQMSGKDGTFYAAGGYWFLRRKFLECLTECRYFYPDEWIVFQFQEAGLDVTVTDFLPRGMEHCVAYRHAPEGRYWAHPERHNSIPPNIYTPRPVFIRPAKPSPVSGEVRAVPSTKGLGLNLSL